MRINKKQLLAAAGLITILIPGGMLEAAGRQTLNGHVPPELAQSQLLRRLSRSETMNLAIGLPLRNQDRLEALLIELYDASSPNYHQFLTPEQFAEAFGPAEAEYQKLIQFAESNGLTVTQKHPNRTLLDVSGSVAEVERAFHVRMNSYAHPARGNFYAPDREPSLDSDLTVLDISGLQNFDIPRPMGLKADSLNRSRPFVTGSGPGGLFIGKDFRAAYAPNVALDGSGQTVGLLEFDGFYPADVKANFLQAGLSAVPTQTVLVDDVSGSPGSANIEVTLDIMMAAYMAPGLSKIIIYEGNTPNDILNRMATDNLAKQLSSSWGFSPINATTEQIFKQYIAQGQSFFQASGDSGAYTGGIMSPSDDPNVTVVGGASLTTSGSGGPWQSETAWSGSGGGISTVYPIPSYQQGLNMASNRGSSTMRNIPDVALTADVQIFLIQNNDQAVAVGGTSAAAPLWAGYTALANQQAATKGKAPVGFMNPLIYSIGKGSNYLTAFHDIAVGNNSGFSAVAGYDLATGWGTPAGQALIDSLNGASATAGFGLSASQTTLSVKPGATAASVITVVSRNGFKGMVSLAVSGLPAGVTASFGPANMTTTSTLTFIAGNSAVTGTSTVTITGTSGALKNTTTITLSIDTPNFNVTASPGSLSVKPGSSGTSTVTVTAQNGFTGPVVLFAAGLPPGVTASFSPISTAGVSTLTFAVGASAVSGTSTITVTGTSGALKSYASIVLSIISPDFSVSVLPGNIAAPQATSVPVVITLGTLNGFAGKVTLIAGALPAGVTASFSPPTAAGTTVLTFAISSKAVPGTSTVIITADSGTLTRTATVGLKVIAQLAGVTLVNLNASANVTGIAADGSTFTPFGLDGGLNGVGTAYSSILLGTQQSINGTPFYLGAANAPDAASGVTVPLPSGAYSTLKMLATAVNGKQTSQTFTVTYTDGSSSSFVQSLSDWFAPQSFTGEVNALSMPYRNTSNGAKDNRTFLLYEYSFTLSGAKKVSSITLPRNRNVVVLAISLTGSTSPNSAATR